MMNEIKQWKESCRAQTKKLATLEKQFSKMFPFNMTTTLKTSIQSLFEDMQQKTNDRFKQQASIFSKLSNIKAPIDELRQTLKTYERKDNYILKIQNISEAVINRMDSFKQEMAQDYQTYYNIEEILNKDLEIAEHKVNQLQKGEAIHEQPNIKPKLPNKQKEKVEPKKIQPIKPVDNQGIQKAIIIIQDDMKQITKQVQNTDMQLRGLGKNLGWIEDDHNDFIMIWNRRKNNNYFQFQQECFNQLKTYTMDQIKTHFDKHKKSIQLQQKRKQLLYQYKLQKQKKRQLQLQLIQKKQKQQRQQANKVKRQIDKAKQDKQTKQKLQNWKLMKEAQKEALQRQKLFQQQKKKQQLLQKKRQVEQKKMYVAQWKQTKQQQQQPKQITRPRSAVNKQTIQRIKQKQDQLLLKKMEVLRTKQLKQTQKIRKQQRMKQKKFVEFNHVRSKLDQKTTAIKQKQRTKFDGKNPKDAQTFGGNLGIIHGRAVPTWRQGI